MKKKLFILCLGLFAFVMQGHSQKKIKMVEENGTVWYKIVTKEGCGAEDSIGKTIVASTEGYDSIFYIGWRRDYDRYSSKLSKIMAMDGNMAYNIINEAAKCHQDTDYPVFGVRKIVNGIPLYGLRDKFLSTGLKFKTIEMNLDSLPYPVGYPKKKRSKSLKQYNEIISSRPSAAAYYNRGIIRCVNDKSNAYKDFTIALGRKDCSLELANAIIMQMEHIEYRRAQRKAFWNEIVDALPDISEGLSQIASTLAENSKQEVYSDSDDMNENGSTKQNGKSTNAKNSKNANHVNWKRLDSAYGGCETQLIKMKSSGIYDEQDKKRLQNKMKEIRQKIYEQSGGYQRPVSPLENW